MDRRREERGLDLGGGGLGLKQVTVGLGLVFVVTLAVVVGKQMSAEAMAVVVGVVCGVAAGIPTAALLLLVLTRRERQRPEPAPRPGQVDGYPPVVVIQGGTPQALPASRQEGHWLALQPGAAMPRHLPRQFHVIGGDDLILDDPTYWEE
jgi:hypothetical protein